MDTNTDPRDEHQASLHDLSADMMQAVSECDDIALLGAHVIGFANRLTVLTHARPEAVDEAAALALFTEYFVKNYPGPQTIISDPNWHAPRIFRAAKYAMKAALTPDQSP